MNLPWGPGERRGGEAEDDTQSMTDQNEDGAEGWARSVAACEEQGLD